MQISTADATGRLYVWGYIPVVVAKWCVEPLYLLNSSPFPFVHPFLPFLPEKKKKCSYMPVMDGRRSHIVACF